MRRVIVSNMMTLDGFFEGPNRELDWHIVGDEFFAYAADMLRGADTILFGRRTYEMMAPYWSAAPSDPIADKMNGLPKLVFSNTLASADWAHSTLVRRDAAAEVARRKMLPGLDMVVLGSAALASSLLIGGLIDEYRVIVNPVILGGGKPLFPDIHGRLRLRLAGVREFGSGIVLLSYQPQ
ncbi:MAG TPA: dihydrofolate reductase family protein [Acidobacteriaceae bacterium]|jgi:dihydrofolate reductase|nr:dihydrofolate reductase family protein [Acidobacteriaceae bacterium]